MVAVPAQWWCLLALCFQGFQVGASCLDGAIPEHALKAFADLMGGKSYPLGIWASDWAASHLAANVAQIVIQETQMDPEHANGVLGVCQIRYACLFLLSE